MRSTRSVAVTPSHQAAREVHANDIGLQEIHRLAEHRGFGFDAADTPAEHAEAVDHRRMRVDADEAVGIEHAVLLQTTCETYSRLIWWQMPLPGGMVWKVLKACALHFRNS